MHRNFDPYLYKYLNNINIWKGYVYAKAKICSIHSKVEFAWK